MGRVAVLLLGAYFLMFLVAATTEIDEEMVSSPQINGTNATFTDNVTAGWFIGNISSTYFNWEADVQFKDYRLTEIGELILSGLIYSEDIIPATNNLYSLGNSTNWFKDAYIKNVYADSLNATNISTSDLDSDRINATNVTIGGFEVYKDGGGDLNIDLG